jgi:hypothetical protein
MTNNQLTKRNRITCVKKWSHVPSKSHPSHLFNLFFETPPPPPNVIMGDIRLLFYCHHCYTGVNLRWQWNLDLILVAIHPTKHKSFGWMVAHYWYQQESTNKRRWSSACRFHKPREIFSIYPTCMPSSISIVETLSPSPTTNCKTKKESKIHGQLSPLTITCTQEIVYYLLACIHERLLCESTR